MNIGKCTLGLSTVGLIFLASCTNSSTGTSTSATQSGNTVLSLTQLVNETPSAKEQFYLRLTDSSVTDSSVVYAVKSLYKSDTVGFNLEVLKDIKPGVTVDGKVDEKNGFVKGALKLSSNGEQSDTFVKALGEIFNLPATGKMTTVTLLPTVFSSNKNEVDLKKSATYTFKLFFDNKLGRPAEVFAIVDTYKKSFELSEKDSTYRKELIAAFEHE
ncbi:hypothetical protein ACL9RF_05455 [Sphingobacterium sp. Mn56C]|uniref:hypothetical protein n=1 Tax=Sphingobacterium sp. Mn56C TaxID=3395261 RepID=UPI003BC80847